MNKYIQSKAWGAGLEFAALKQVAGYFEAIAPKGKATPVVGTLVLEPLSGDLTRREQARTQRVTLRAEVGMSVGTSTRSSRTLNR